MSFKADVFWMINTPLKTMDYTRGYHSDSDESPVPVPKSHLKLRIPDFCQGDKVALICDGDNNPIIVKSIRKGTLKCLLKTIEKGMNEIIDNEDKELRQKLYNFIGTDWIHPKMRINLISKLETGTLKVMDLVGDANFYNGYQTRENGIWKLQLSG